MKPLATKAILILILMNSCFDKEETPLAHKYAQAFHESKILFTDSLDLEKFEEWEKHSLKEYEKYKVKKNKLKGVDIKGIDIKIIGSAWCSDTREQVSRFIKVLEQIQMDAKWVSFHFLDRKKEKPNDAFVQGYYFSKIPEFVIYRDGEKIGSIIETPHSSLEEDFMKILKE